MTEFAMPAHGAFCWNELATTDDDGAKKFYSELFGWTFKEGDASGMKYSEIITGGGVPSGGVYKMPAEMGQTPPHWVAYVAVEDVNASAKKVEELGGKIVVPPMDIPNVGRFCVLSDPAGAHLAMITLSGAHH